MNTKLSEQKGDGSYRCAIAGAIAWEALHNFKPQPSFYTQWIGPGKVHYRDSDPRDLKLFVTTAEQTEKRGYLPKTTEQRKEILSSPSGSIMCIGAIMRA